MQNRLHRRAIGSLRRDDQHALEKFRFQRHSGAVELLPADVGIAPHDLDRNVPDLVTHGPIRAGLLVIHAARSPRSFAKGVCSRGSPF
jgi:hypothetical protein